MFTEDLSAFFQTADFALAATYKAGGIGTGTTVNVIFDRAHIEQLGGVITGTNPVALGKATDFSSFTNSDTLTISSIVYRITASDPQDDGATVLLQLEDQT